jgi:hypothetical protein
MRRDRLAISATFVRVSDASNAKVSQKKDERVKFITWHHCDALPTNTKTHAVSPASRIRSSRRLHIYIARYNSRLMPIHKYENVELSKLAFVMEECLFINCVLNQCELFFSGGHAEFENVTLFYVHRLSNLRMNAAWSTICAMSASLYHATNFRSPSWKSSR